MMTPFLLIAAHALCDFALQNDLMANAKNRFKAHPIHRHVPWFYWLASHSLIHGAAVALILHSPTLGLMEACFHFIIDDEKCRGSFGIHTDQILHILLKGFLYSWYVFLIRPSGFPY